MGIAAPSVPAKHSGSVGASRSSLSHSTEEGREEHEGYYNRSRRPSRRTSMAHCNVRYEVTLRFFARFVRVLYQLKKSRCFR